MRAYKSSQWSGPRLAHEEKAKPCEKKKSETAKRMRFFWVDDNSVDECMAKKWFAKLSYSPEIINSNAK